MLFWNKHEIHFVFNTQCIYNNRNLNFLKGPAVMAKRIADKELTDRNWDQEEEGEEAGTFSIASVDVLKNRPIKKAKRRNIGESENPGAFKGFKGFSLTSSASSAAAPTTGFSGFGNGGGFKGLAGLSNGSTPFGGFSSTTAPGLTFNGPASSSTTTAGDVTTNGSAPSSTQSPGALGSGISGGGSVAVGNNKEYSRQLTALNCSVRDWIVKHVNGNPLCDLNPIFRDYEQHLASIERKYGATAAAATDGGSHGNAQRSRAMHKKHRVHASIRTFRDENGEEDSDEPPKVEVREIKEKDAFYSQRCKLFYKKDAEFKEKGVGTLHLKPTAEGRTQLVIRADTNLGNILLNIVLAPSMPSSRVGKNNVVLACVPNPPVDTKSPTVPMPMLIRVKTTEDADALYKILEEKKA
ncbi:unnamed protein product [Arctogadus glacialis]